MSSSNKRSSLRKQPSSSIDNKSANNTNNSARSSSSESNSTKSSNANSLNSSNGSQQAKTVRSSRLKPNRYLIEEDSDQEENDDKKGQVKVESCDIKEIKSSSSSTASAAASCFKVNIENLAKLEQITGLSRAEAMQLLEASNNKLEKAVDLHFNGNDKISTSKTNQNSNLKNNLSSKRSFKEENDVDTKCTYIDDCQDEVRAPIPQKIEKLIDYDPYAMQLGPQVKRARTAFDGFRNMKDELNGGDSAVNNNDKGLFSNKTKTLSSLYQPPIDLLFTGSFEASKIYGCEKNKWVLLNVQDLQDFNCQILNRDIWKDDTIREIIKANFVFLQVYFDSVEGKKLINYYQIKLYPFIGIIDPRTGEKLLQLNHSKLDQLTFCEKITTFLGEYDSPIKEDEDASQYINSTLKKVVQSDNVIKANEKINNEDEIVQVEDLDEDDQEVVIVNGGTKNDTINKNGRNTINGNSKLYPSMTNSPKKSTTNIFQVNDSLKSFSTSNNKAKSKKIKSETEQENDDEIDIISTSNTFSENKYKNQDFDQEYVNNHNTFATNKKKYSILQDDENQQVNIDDQDEDDCCVTSKDDYQKKNEKKKRSPSPLSFVKSKQELPSALVNNNNMKFESNLEQDEQEKDCTIRILFPNGDRFDFCTNGNSKLKTLIDHLVKKGFKKSNHELIERCLIPINNSNPKNKPSSQNQNELNNNDSIVFNQSRNLFNSDFNMSFKELNLFPRIFLLLQES